MNHKKPDTPGHRKEEDPLAALVDILKTLKGVRMTFSANCCTGIIYLLGPDARCECWRCRQKRGEDVTEETEAIARKLSRQAQAAQRKSVREWLRKHEAARGAADATGESNT
jgi:hypothetical protein